MKQKLLNQKSRFERVYEVNVEQLIEREILKIDTTFQASNIHQKSVMVTGAGGSIATELCRQIIMQRPKRLVLFELNEYSLYRINLELRAIIEQYQLDCELLPILGSVQNRGQLAQVISRFVIETIYHSAAYKHVPLVEYNQLEAICNNVFGSLNCAQLAIEFGVRSFVLISTDKAVRPTSIMGASKRLSELVLLSLAELQNKTQFCMVRFGNVLDSSGSVLPLFRQQVAEGGPINLTHKDASRYFMTIGEAVQLVLQAGALAKGGELFVLDMGRPIKIIELARRLLRLAGLTEKNALNPKGDIEIKISALRTDEKIIEESLFSSGAQATMHPKIFTINAPYLPWNKLNPCLQELKVYCDSYNLEQVRTLLQQLPIDFTPIPQNYDLLRRTEQIKASD